MKDLINNELPRLFEDFRPSYIFYAFAATLANFVIILFSSSQTPYIGTLSQEDKCKLVCSKSSLIDCLDSCSSNSKYNASNQLEELLLSRPVYILTILLIVTIGVFISYQKRFYNMHSSLLSDRTTPKLSQVDPNKFESEDFLEKLI